MQWTIPGTTLTGKRSDACRTDGLFQSMFLAGGLTLSQVSSITGLEPYTVQNWVKRKFLPAPVNKRYTMEQVCRIINLNILKGPMPLEQAVKLMSYLNGDLSDESDDLVDDTLLFFLFVDLASRAEYLGDEENWEAELDRVTERYPEAVPGAREKLQKVLKIMLIVWLANRMKARADALLLEM